MPPKKLKYERRQKESKFFGVFLSLSLLTTMLLGLGLAYFALADEVAPLYKSLLSRSWAKTSGKVINTGISQRSISRGVRVPTLDGEGTISRDGRGCVPEITYSFLAGGKEFQGNRINFSGGGVVFDLDEDCRAFLERYKNKEVEVFYDSGNPLESTLSREYAFDPDDYQVGCCCGSLGIVFVIMVWFSVKDLIKIFRKQKSDHKK